jgi:hypothetical protein
MCGQSPPDGSHSRDASEGSENINPVNSSERNEMQLTLVADFVVSAHGMNFIPERQTQVTNLPHVQPQVTLTLNLRYTHQLNLT